VLTPLGFSLLRQLADGQFHSGEDLAAKVGLTRARVSQVLKDAGTAGLALERVKGRGYRLLEAPDFLDAKKVQSWLIELAAGRNPLPGPVEVVDQIESTSSELMRRAQRRDVHQVALAAEWQSAGRCRGARGPRSRGQPHFSLGWKFEQGAGFWRPVARRRRRRRARARGRRLQGCRAQVAERPHSPPPQGRRHPDRTEWRRVGPTTTVIGVGLMSGFSRRPQGHSCAGHGPCVIAGRRAPPIDRNRLLAGAARRGSRRSSTCTKATASRRLPPSGNTAMRTGKPVRLLLPTGRRSPARWPASMSGALVLADARAAHALSGEIRSTAAR
jgi:biotin operon repressor